MLSSARGLINGLALRRAGASEAAELLLGKKSCLFSLSRLWQESAPCSLVKYGGKEPARGKGVQEATRGEARCLTRGCTAPCAG